jgi:hypothetical protein
MTGLPTRILPQSMPIADGSDGSPLYMKYDWYLWLYSVSSQVFSTGDQPAQTIEVGASPFIFQAPSNGTVSITGGAVENVTIVRQGINVPTGIGAYQFMNDEKGSGGNPGFAAGVDFVDGTTTALTLSKDYITSASVWVSFDGTVQGANTYTLTGTVLTFNAPIPVGTVNVFVKGAIGSGTSGGLVPLRAGDGVEITYTIAPTVIFLPA